MKPLTAIHAGDMAQVASALKTAGEHRKVLEEAQRMEQEYVSLMTGQRSVEGGSRSSLTGSEETEGETTARVSSAAIELSFLVYVHLYLCVV